MFVCLGNICRSPLAEAIFKEMLEKQQFTSKVIVDSSGTANYHIGMPPDHRTFSNAKSNGILINHVGKQFCKDDFFRHDYIIVMDESNYKEVVSIGRNIDDHRCTIYKMRHFDVNGPDMDVPDPYFGGAEGFQNVFDILNRSCEKFLEFLVNKHQIR
jgi:protein-tyrosine phosphatase